MLPPDAFRALLEAGSGGDWKRLGASAYTPLRRMLRLFEPESTAAAVAGLLTEPAFHSATLRLEMLQHLAASACRGTRRADAADLRRWVNDVLGSLPIRRMEDPVEDVFVSNVIAPGGNFRLFEGVWELNDASVQSVVEALVRTPWGRHAPPVLSSVLALLRLSDALAGRAGVSRWTTTERPTPATEALPPDLDVDALRRRAQFSWADIESLGIDASDLTPFVLPAGLRGRLRSEAFGHSSLERHPLIATNDGVILACPPAVSPAIRRYVLEVCEQADKLDGLAHALRWVQARELFENALPRVDAPTGIGESALPPSPIEPSQRLPWDEVHCPIDVDKAAVVIFLPDSLIGAARDGLTEPTFDATQNRRLGEHLRAAVARLASTATGGGLVVVVYGGLGRGRALGLPYLPSGWHAVVMSAGDFSTFARSPEASLLRLWKLETQRERLEEASVQVPDTNGLLNTYAFWAKQHYALCPDEMPYPATAPSLVQIGTEFIYEFRLAERRLHDVHAVPLDADRTRLVRVHRLARNAFFPSMLERPLFVSEEAARQGELVGVCEHPALTVWVLASKPTAAREAGTFLYKLWEAVLSWLDRLVPEVATLMADTVADDASEAMPAQTATTPPLELHLQFADEEAWRMLSRPGEPAEARPGFQWEADQRRIVVSIPFGLVALLRRPENDGERALLEVVAESLLTAVLWRSRERNGERVGAATAAALTAEAAHACVERAMRNADARHVHLFEAARPTDHIAALHARRAANPRFIFDEDVAAWTDGLAWQAVDRDALAPEARDAGESDEGAGGDQTAVRLIAGRNACTRTLNRLVAAIWTRLRLDLAQVNGPSLVALVLDNLEAIARDREQWSRTARALLSLYGDQDDVTQISTVRESERTRASTSGRALVEMAVCTCPAVGGRRAALSDLDHLSAGVSELIGLAFDSDAIRSGLAAPEIRVNANGTLRADRAFMHDLVVPFSSEVHVVGFRAAAAAYAELYDRRSAATGGEDGEDGNPGPRDDACATAPAGAPGDVPRPEFDADFSAAFASEFGLAPSRVVDGLAQLVEMGLEGGDLVVSTTRGVIAARLTAECGYDAADVAAFFGTLALTPRPRWDETPPGFLKRDWEPWHFRRRLSLTSRPLVTCGPADDDATPVFFGLHHLGTSVSYLFENVQSAWFPLEFFTTDAMRRYWGRVADAEGAAFTQEAAAALRALGWHTATEVQMSSLGAPEELGDLDVVAWRADDPRVLLIECKRLQPARTIGEIAELLNKFRGEGNDRLAVHVRRIAWVRAHPDALARRLGLKLDGAVLTPRLVTNRDVPMRFRSDLPLSPDQIIPLARLADEHAQPADA